MPATGKTNTAALVSGSRIVVRNAGSFLAPVATKTGTDNVIATVREVVTVSGRARVQYIVVTDLGSTVTVPGHQTFWDADQLTGRTLKTLTEQTEARRVELELVEDFPLPTAEEIAEQPEQTNEILVTVVNALDGLMHVHHAGCRDIARTRQNGQFDILAISEDDALREIWSDFLDEWSGDLSWGESSTKFYPCVNFPRTPETYEERLAALREELTGIPQTETEYLTTEPNGTRLAESVEELSAPAYTTDNAWQNFADLAMSAPTEVARAYWAIKANERVFLT